MFIHFINKYSWEILLTVNGGPTLFFAGVQEERKNVGGIWDDENFSGEMHDENT